MRTVIGLEASSWVDGELSHDAATDGSKAAILSVGNLSTYQVAVDHMIPEFLQKSTALPMFGQLGIKTAYRKIRICLQLSSPSSPSLHQPLFLLRNEGFFYPL